tara:strand:- start:75302 stop:77311 length:2010 start_codon:yes stop_codon:yes gene_type:complete
VRDFAAGKVFLPGSKSISIRLLLLSALCKGRTRIQGLLDSEDTRIMMAILRQLGIEINEEKSKLPDDYQTNTGNLNLLVVGCEGNFPELKNKRVLNLFVGNSGLSVRTILPALALNLSKNACQSEVVLDGVERMRERPISDLVDGLTPLGIKLSYEGKSGFLPLRVKPSTLQRTDCLQINCLSSSQFLTGLLQAVPILLDKKNKYISIRTVGEIISRPYIDLTIHIMRAFNIKVNEEVKGLFVIRYSEFISPESFLVESDASSASYFFAMGLLGKGPIKILGIDKKSYQGDLQLLPILERMGARVYWEGEAVSISGGNNIQGIEVDCLNIPDASMVLPILALYANSTTRLTNIGSWRFKETDRIRAVSQGLINLGATVKVGKDWLEVVPPDKLKPATIETFKDHRIAMTFSLASFRHPGDENVVGRVTRIVDPECVAKTFPVFFQEFSRICSEGVPVITIDGPTASGKGTVGELVASQLGFKTLDSGIFYRSLAVISIMKKIEEDDEVSLKKLAKFFNLEFNSGRIIWEKHDLTDKLRDERIGILASKISRFQSVRDGLLGGQRDLARLPGLVADGRDMGSKVFPKAKLKVFLTAKPEIRAKRRFKQLIQKEITCKLEDILRDVKDRDRRDIERAHSPLHLAEREASVVIDSSDMSLDQVVDRILAEFN